MCLEVSIEVLINQKTLYIVWKLSSVPLKSMWAFCHIVLQWQQDQDQNKKMNTCMYFLTEQEFLFLIITTEKMQDYSIPRALYEGVP